MLYNNNCGGYGNFLWIIILIIIICGFGGWGGNYAGGCDNNCGNNGCGGCNNGCNGCGCGF